MRPPTGLSISVRVNKIHDLGSLGHVLARHRQNGDTIVHCHGVFDLLHVGHVKHFEAARRNGSVLVVTITPDRFVNKGPDRPVFHESLRAEVIAALECVDYVAVNEWPTAAETIKLLQPHYYVKGSDYKNRDEDITGGITRERDACAEVGASIIFTDEIVFSASKLLNDHFQVLPAQAKRFVDCIKERHERSAIDEYFERIKRLKVLVIGEPVIDEYHYCRAIGKSGKEPVIAARPLNKEAFAGGVLAVANHIADFVPVVDCVTLLGRENTREAFIRDHLKANVNIKFFYQEDNRTITKIRFVEPAFYTKEFELYDFEDLDISEELSRTVAAYLGQVAGKYDLVLVADYGHGFLAENVREVLCKNSKHLALNAQINAGNLGFNVVTKYARADYMCISEEELHLAYQQRRGDLAKKIRDIGRKMGCRRVTITRGSAGLIVYEEPSLLAEISRFSDKVLDRIGAGDAVLAVTALAEASEMPMDLVGFVGNAAGAIAVGIVGNRSFVEKVPLMKYLHTLLK